MKPQFWCVVPAAGQGTRMQAPLPKQYLSLAGRTVIEHTLGRLLAWGRLRGVVVAIAPGDEYFARLPVAADPRLRIVAGGSQRCESVLAALDALAGEAGADDWVLVHDAARPCVRPSDLARLSDTLREDATGGILAIRATDTVKQAGDDGVVQSTLPRESVWLAATPQMFRLGLLRDAIADALAANLYVTDEAQAMERMGHRVRLVEGARDNIKITRPEDLALAGFWLRLQQQEQA